MADENNIFEWAFKGLVTVVGAIAAWLWTGVSDDIRTIKKQADDSDRNLLQHKFDTEKNYVNKSDMQVAFERIDYRLNDMGRDIKALLVKIGDTKKD